MGPSIGYDEYVYNGTLDNILVYIGMHTYIIYILPPIGWYIDRGPRYGLELPLLSTTELRIPSCFDLDVFNVEHGMFK